MRWPARNGERRADPALECAVPEGRDLGFGVHDETPVVPEREVARMMHSHGNVDRRKLALRTAEAAVMLSISPRTLWNWTQQGRIPCRRVDGVILYSVQSLQDWLDGKLTAEGTDPSLGE